MPQRPTVSVVVPFAGTPTQLNELLDRFQKLTLAPGDELIIADNRLGAQARDLPGAARLHPAGAVASPGFARNRGAAAAIGTWLVFLDADTDPAADLLDAYFMPPPQPGTAVLAGAILDTAGPDAAASARHSVARGQMSQLVTLGRSSHPYAQSANVAIRRDAFIDAGGFEEHARAAEDADLCFRLTESGFTIESRPRATVGHSARATLAGALLQLAIHGSGAAWCNRRHPGSFPPAPARQMLRRVTRSIVNALRAGLGGDREAATFALLEVPEALAFELGRLIPNRPRWRMRP